MSAHDTAPLLLLSAMLVIAVQSDLRHRRIPNVLSLFGIIAALALHCQSDGLHGLAAGLGGAAVGFLCFVPFYLLRGMGAGDVKLLAAVGAILGPQGAVLAALFSLLAGGFTAIGYVLWQAARASAIAWVREGVTAVSVSAFVAAQSARRDRLAFALPIALGSIAAVFQQGGFTNTVSWPLRWFS